MELKKRKRGENWSTNDKNLLKSLCADKISVIENKSVTTNTNQQKKEAWNQIKDQFNSACDVTRDVAQIQLQWKSVKLKLKAVESAYRKDRKKTGGGPPPKSPSKEDQELIDRMPNEFKIDLNEFDSDGATLKNPEIEEYEYEYEDIEILSQNDCEKENVKDESNISQPKPMPKKRMGKKRKVNNSDSSYKKEVFELSKMYMAEEHEEKIKVLKLEQQCREQELKNLRIEEERIRTKTYL